MKGLFKLNNPFFVCHSGEGAFEVYPESLGAFAVANRNP